ncbi:unnamed protein product, partial [Ascophyllum nodosum]
AVFEYILEQTNDYWRHCTMTHPSEVEICGGKAQRSVEFNHESRKVGFVRRTD